MLFQHSKKKMDRIINLFINKKNKLKKINILSIDNTIQDYSKYLLPININTRFKLENNISEIKYDIDNLNKNMNINELFSNSFIINNRQYLIIGCIHGSFSSGKLLIDYLENFNPDSIVVELSKYKFDILKNDYKKNSTIYKSLYNNIKNNIKYSKDRLLEIKLSYEYSLRNKCNIIPSDLEDLHIKNNNFRYSNCSCNSRYKSIKFSYN